ncbi:MAG TPA: hybrid sensor histidine kinase/response regulator [Thiothrix sp.]|nr:hybrid sensor histidine kinase/response regulator [Thiothrix sp.]
MTLDADIKETLAEELDDIALELAMPSQEPANTTEIAADMQLFQHLHSETARLADTAEMYEFEELTHLAIWVLKNISALKTQPTRLEQQHEQGHYYAWIELVATLLREEETDTQAALLTELNTNLQQSTWSIAIDNALVQHLFTRLSSAPLSDAFIASLSTPSATSDTDSDVDSDVDCNVDKASYHLAWDEDIHPELLNAFFIETPDLVTETTALMRAIATGNADQAIHQKAARLAHTIKGSSAVVGIKAIANFAHKLEDILEHSVESTLPPTAAECLIESADCLEAMFDSLQTRTTPPPQYPALLEQLDDWDKKIKTGEITKILETTEIAPSIVTVSNTPQPVEAEQHPTLTWDEDIHPELLAAYLSETPEHIQQISKQLRAISNDNDSAQHNKATYQQIAILAHTLKGSSATVGISAFVDIAAPLEAIFETEFETAKDQATQNTFSKTQQDLLNATANLLESLHKSLLSNKTYPNNYASLLSQLTAWQTQQEEENKEPIIEKTIEKSAEELTEEPAEEPVTKPIEKQDPISTPSITTLDTAATKEKPKKQRKKTPFKLPPMRAIQSVFIPPKVTQPAPIQTINLNETTLRVPVSLIEKLLNFSNELITSNTQLTEYVQTLLNDKRTMYQRNEHIRNLIDELEWTVSRQSTLHTQQTPPNEFDALEMDNYNALHGITNLLAETTNDEREASLALIKQFNVLKDHVIAQQKINKALNTNVLAMRMEPVTLITPRLERIVRETCRETHKKVNFSIIGDNLALDTDVLKGLLDPLLHLLRNAIDHGIEAPEIRQQHNKSATGNITLQFNQQGDHVLLSLKDDGAGIDAEAIYQKAIKKGLIKADAPLSEDEKLQLIVHAGLSTRKTVSKISGRGVGMDVVNTAINDLSGSLRINSKKGVGTEIQLHVPLTLVVVNVLLVKLANHMLAIPSSAIHQIYYLEENSIQRKQEKKQEQCFIHFEDNDIPLLSLSTLLDWPLTPFNNEVSQPIVIVKHHKMQYAFYFDQVINFQEIVLKTLKPWMTKIQGVNGVCLLQDGVVAPILNLAELLADIPAHAFHIQTATKLTKTAKTTTNKRILVVDDSLSNRKALSLTIEPLGYEVSTAIDGADAITQLEKTTFGLIITDLEMPTMNGLQLSEYIREQTDIQHIPIVMVTSRSTEKHRTLAKKAGVNDYLTKPVNKTTLKTCIEKFISNDNTENTTPNAASTNTN